MMAWLKQTFFGAGASETGPKKDNARDGLLTDNMTKDVSDEEMAQSDFGQESNTARQLGK